MTHQGQRGPRSNEDPPTRGVLPETLDEASPNSPAFVAFHGAEKFCPHFFRVSMTHAGVSHFARPKRFLPVRLPSHNFTGEQS